MSEDDMSFFLKRVTGDDNGFGQDLRDLRIVRGMTEVQLAKASGIPAEIITFLEGEKLKDIQDPHYAERHVRALAIALDVRPEFFLNKYRKMLAAHGIERGTAPPLRPTPRKRDFFVTSRVLIVASTVCVALLVVGYEIWQVRNISAAPTLEILSPEEGYKASGSSVEVRGLTEVGAFVNINGQQAVVRPDGSFISSLRIPSGLTTIRVEARRRYGQTTVAERRVLYEREESAFMQ